MSMVSSATWTCPKLTMPPMCLAALANVGASCAHGAHPSAPNDTTHASRPLFITRSLQLSSFRVMTPASASSARTGEVRDTHSATTDRRSASDLAISRRHDEGC